MVTRIFALLHIVGCTDYEFYDASAVTPGEVQDDIAEFATGVPSQNAEHWDLNEVGGVDVLFFGDTSGSMSVELVTLGEQVTVFVDELASYTTNWHLMAVTGPTGCGVNGVLTPETPDYAGLFASGITTTPGEDHVDEWGLYNVAAALELTDPEECNDGFLRDDARLHVIFISDEDDNSPGWDDTKKDAYWEPYTESIISHKAQRNQVVFSGVIGPTPDGCDGAEPGWGYAEAIEHSAGELLSICEDWYKQINQLVEASVLFPIFHLQEAAMADTIEVSVNGVIRSEGWSYDAAQVAVVFSSNPPILGDLVHISYRPIE